MNKISTFFNYLILLVCLLLLVFSWSLYFTKNRLISACFAFLAFVIFTLVFFFVKEKKAKKANAKILDKRNREKLSINFKILSENGLMEYFKALLSVNDCVIEEKGYLQTEKENYFFLTDRDEVLENDLCHCLRRANFNKEIKVYCQSVSEKARALSERFKVNISFFDLGHIKELIDTKNMPLELTEIVEKAKPKPLVILKSMAQRQKIKGYLFLSLIILFFSFISPYKIFYQIFASILIIYCIVIYFLKI